MIKWFKKLFCSHKWEMMTDYDVNYYRQCVKCEQIQMHHIDGWFKISEDQVML